MKERPGGITHSGKERAELFEDARAEAKRDQILLVGAGIAAESDGGQKLLEGLFLFSLNDFFVVFGFLESEVVFKSEANGFVEREPKGFIAGRAGGYAAVERVGGGGWVGRLRAATAAAPEKTNRQEAPAPLSTGGQIMCVEFTVPIFSDEAMCARDSSVAG